MSLREKWLCRRWFNKPYRLKQVFVKETESMFIVESIPDEETNSLLGYKKRVKKSEKLLYDTATEAIQVAIAETEAKIAAAHRTIVAETATLRELDILLRPR